jgi:hypothetical protein
MRRRALEEQVFEQVCHAGLAVVLVPRADPVGEVDRRRRLRVVGDEQHLQAVRKAKLVDTFDEVTATMPCGRRWASAGWRTTRRSTRTGRSV